MSSSGVRVVARTPDGRYNTVDESEIRVIPLPSDDAFAPVFTIGQVSSFLQVQQAFLRRLDAEQVVQPARSEGGQRRYSRHDITRVQRVVDLVNDGLTVAGILRVFALEAQVSQLEAELTKERALRKTSNGDA